MDESCNLIPGKIYRIARLGGVHSFLKEGEVVRWTGQHRGQWKVEIVEGRFVGQYVFMHGEFINSFELVDSQF